MEIRPRLVGDVTVIAVFGKIDAVTSKELDIAFSSNVVDKRRVVVDMEGVDYLSSSGLRVLMSHLGRARKGGGDLLISSLQPVVREVFEITGAKQFFSIYKNPDEAVAGIMS
jgi:anti-anti-sigma factor